MTDKINTIIGVRCGDIRYVITMAIKNNNAPGIKNSILLDFLGKSPQKCKRTFWEKLKIYLATILIKSYQLNPHGSTYVYDSNTD